MTYNKGIAKIIKYKLRENQAIILESTTYGYIKRVFCANYKSEKFYFRKNFT